MSTKKTPKRGGSSIGRYLLVLGALALVTAGFFFGFRAAQPPPPPDFTASREAASTPAVGAPSTQPAVETPPDVSPAEPSEDPPTATGGHDATRAAIDVQRQPAPGSDGSKPRIALVIDDLGRSLQDLRTLRALGVPITYAVLPFEVKTPEVVAELQRRGEEIFCHLPMEAKSNADPGPGALRRSMADAELRQAVEKALAAVPGAVGANNHMGSAIVSDPRSMRAVIDVLAERRLAFLDSRTTVDTLGYTLARQRGLAAGERQVFLDTHRDKDFIRRQFKALLVAARERGGAIAIA
ncbi:MAG: divergent polysaccharide deacetylase family protein, partial [Acidobacteriota bacterium]